MQKTTPIIFQDDWRGYDLENFSYERQYFPYLKSVLIPRGIINDRIERLASDILYTMSCKTAGCEQTDEIICLCILKGGHQFLVQLVNELSNLNKHTSIGLPIRFEFIRLKSYINEQSHDLKITGDDMLSEINDKPVLIVEDIIDTGRTMELFLKHIEHYRPRSVSVACLLYKRNPQNIYHYKPEFVGFEIPKRFVVGFGLDYNEHFRDLSHVCVINEEAIARFKSA